MVLKKFAIVLVSYNRCNYLESTLPKYSSMAILPELILIIDNASTDGTSTFLKTWKQSEEGFRKEFVILPSNLGGSGGFSFGIKKIFEEEKMDYIMLADDDAIPDTFLLQEFSKIVSKGKDNIAAYSTVRKDPESKEICDNCVISLRPGVFSLKKKVLTVNQLGQDKVPINILSFVGAIIPVKTIEKVGLPNSDFFIYWDDIEYSLRINQTGPIFMLPSVAYYHKTPGTKQSNLWKEYYEVRNSIYTVNKYFPKWTSFWFTLLKRIKKTSLLSRLLKRRGNSEIKMLKQAINDGKKGRLGKNKDYLPKSL
jgi:GT2 family glycosyltransferase